MKKIWINTTTAPANLLDVIRENTDYVFVIANTVDVRSFLDNAREVEELAEAGQLVFHAWFPSWEDQWKNKEMFSSAIQKKVPAGQVRQYIPEAEALGAVIDAHAIQKDVWLPKQITFTEEFDPNLLAEVGLEPGATRSQVKEACESNNRPDIWDAYEVWYVKKLAYQHGCDHTVNNNGEIVPV